MLVDGLPVYHRWNDDAGAAADVVVHVHGFAISGNYLEPTAALLAARHRTYVPDLPGMGRSVRPAAALDVPGLAGALIGYLDVVGVAAATFVGNSLGCPIILEVAAAYPDRIERAVLVSPAGGPNNQPLRRAMRQMATDSLREPASMVPIATRDYLHFGVPQSLSLFKAMTRYPTLERLESLVVPTLVVVGTRDPFVRHDRIHVLSALPHVEAARVRGAHASELQPPGATRRVIEAFLAGTPLDEARAHHPDIEVVVIE